MAVAIFLVYFILAAVPLVLRSYHVDYTLALVLGAQSVEQNFQFASKSYNQDLNYLSPRKFSLCEHF